MSRPARSKHDRSPASACWAAKVTRRFANRSRKFSVSPCQNLFGMQANGPVEFGALQPILDSPGDSWRRKTVLEEGKETHHSSLPIEIGNCRNGRATEALSRSVYPVATPGHDALHSASQAACSVGLAQNSRQLEPWDLGLPPCHCQAFSYSPSFELPASVSFAFLTTSCSSYVLWAF